MAVFAGFICGPQVVRSGASSCKSLRSPGCLCGLTGHCETVKTKTTNSIIAIAKAETEMKSKSKLNQMYEKKGAYAAQSKCTLLSV